MRYLSVAALLLILVGCSSQNIVEENERNVPALQNTGKYYVAPLKIDFDPPEAWEIPDEEWELWAEGWEVDFKAELRSECYKDIEFVDTLADAEGATVTCNVYEMDNGGFSGFGGNGFARAKIVVKDDTGKVIYDAKLEGTGANSGFESTVTRGRLKFAILNLARQIADVLENGK